MMSDTSSFRLPPRKSIDPWQAVGTALPVLYVWSLPALASVGFAHECKDYPRCPHFGQSVSNFISNTHATGAMAGVFFYPCLHVWTNALHARKKEWVYSTLIVFQVCFGLFLSLPVTEAEYPHGVAVTLFCWSGMVHYSVMLKHCAEDRMWYCIALLCVSIASLVIVQSLACFSYLFDPTFLPNHCPFVFWFFESLGLSSMAMLPLLWYREHRDVPSDKSLGPLERLLSTSTNDSIYLPSRPGLYSLRAVATGVPVLYVWFLPALASLGFAQKCKHYPRCKHFGRSVSSYIANTHATGAMAGVFFYPCLHMWLNALYARKKKGVYPTLITFQFCFGLFLTTPTTELEDLHCFFVNLFCWSGVVHYGVMLLHCSQDHMRYCTVLLSVSIFSLVVVQALGFLGVSHPRLLPNHYPWLFWCFESLGLSSMAVFPLLWNRERFEHSSISF